MDSGKLIPLLRDVKIKNQALRQIEYSKIICEYININTNIQVIIVGGTAALIHSSGRAPFTYDIDFISRGPYREIINLLEKEGFDTSHRGGKVEELDIMIEFMDRDLMGTTTKVDNNENILVMSAEDYLADCLIQFESEGDGYGLLERVETICDNVDYDILKVLDNINRYDSASTASKSKAILEKINKSG